MPLGFTGRQPSTYPARGASGTNRAANSSIKAGILKELLRSTDLVRLNFLDALLRGSGIEAVTLDRAVGGLFGAALPARLMVEDEDFAQARRVLREAGIEDV